MESYKEKTARSRGLIEDLFIKLEDRKEEIKTFEAQLERLEVRADDMKSDISKVRLPRRH